MSVPAFLKFLDAPFAIVVGGVAAVLITLQLGAVGWLAQSQVDHAAQRAVQARQVRVETDHRCAQAASAGAEAWAACRQALLRTQNERVALR